MIADWQNPCMAQSNFRYRLAAFLRRFPLFIRLIYSVYRVIQPKFTIGVTGIVFNANGQVLLVEHLFHPRLPWGLPGGWIGNNEDPATAAQRELQEELALTVTIQTLVRAEKTQYNHIDMAFLCQAHNEIGTLSYELLAYRWHDISTLPRLHKFHYDAILQAHVLWEQTPCPD